APARTTRDPSVELGKELLGGQSLGECVSVAAVRTEYDVVRTQVGGNADGDCLLADAGVASAVNETLLMRLGQLQFGFADQQHLAKELHQNAALNSSRQHRGHCFPSYSSKRSSTDNVPGRRWFLVDYRIGQRANLLDLN